jgi:hypothetical protein
MRIQDVVHELLGLAHRQSLRRDPLRRADLPLAVEREQRPAMAHFDLAVEEERLHRFREVEQPQQVGRRGARAADRVGGLLVGQLELVDQAMHALRFLQRIEVFALDVLDQRHRERRLVGDLAHDDRHFLQAGQARGAPATLAGDDLVALGVDRTHEDRLHQALYLDRGGELAERGLVHPGARLVLPRLQPVDARRGERLASRRGRFVASAQQCVEPASQSLLLDHRPSPSADHAAASACGAASARPRISPASAR